MSPREAARRRPTLCPPPPLPRKDATPPKLPTPILSFSPCLRASVVILVFSAVNTRLRLAALRHVGSHFGSPPASHARSLQRRQHTVVPKRNPADTNAGRVVDRVGDGSQHRFQRRLARSVRRQVRTVRIRIAVHQHDVDAFPARRRGGEWDARTSPRSSPSRCRTGPPREARGSGHAAWRIPLRGAELRGLTTSPQSCAHTRRFAHT